jgi:hypothetical protein
MTMTRLSKKMASSRTPVWTMMLPWDQQTSCKILVFFSISLRQLLKSMSDHVNTEEAAIGTCNIYNVYCEEVNAIMRQFIDFTNYET